MSSLHNEILYGTGPLRAVRLGVGMGEGEGVLRLDESFQPVVDWWQRHDWAIMAGDILQWSSESIAAGGAGLRSMIALVNPQGSGRIYLVEEIISIGSLMQVRFVVPPPVVGVGGWLAGTASGQRDSRWPTVPIRTMTNITAAVTGAARYRLPASVITRLPIIVGQNVGLIVCPETDNVAVQTSIAWRERVLLPGEPTG